MNFEYITLHCSASPNLPRFDAKSIDMVHGQRAEPFMRNPAYIGNNGLKHIGYHFFIKTDGTVEEGRTLDEKGAHVAGHNTGNIGICLCGGTTKDPKVIENNFTNEQFDSLSTLIRQLLDAYPIKQIVGHNDWDTGKHKACPVFSVVDFLSDYGLPNNSVGE